MRDERGFFTLIGICFLLVAAILVKGVQESEKNYSYITSDFYAEAELQNVADSALMEAVEKITSGEITLQVPTKVTHSGNQHEVPITLSGRKGIDVKVFYEYGLYPLNTARGNIWFMTRDYKDKKDKPLTEIGADGKSTEVRRKGVILISVASRDSDLTTGGKIYRRALGYFLTDEDKTDEDTVYFMNSLSSTYD